MPVKIHNKDYKTVAERVNEFREKYGEQYRITTKIITFEGDDCIVKAFIKDPDGMVVATGLAHEVKGSTNINKTSHVENCETSAIGRALAAFGFAGTEYASADEVSTAIINQAIKDATDRLKKHINIERQYRESVYAIKDAISKGDLSTASEEWFVLEDEVKAALWISPSDGGCFTNKEREIMKSTEFRTANGEAA